MKSHPMQPENPKKTPVRIFVSYAHRDNTAVRYVADLMGLLEGHLRLYTEFKFELWWDPKLLAGSNWESVILEKAEKCHLSLLLVSASFLASPYILDKELPILKKNGKPIIPVYLIEYDFRAADSQGLDKLQFFSAVEKGAMVSFDSIYTLGTTAQNSYAVKLAQEIKKQVELNVLPHLTPGFDHGDDSVGHFDSRFVLGYAKEATGDAPKLEYSVLRRKRAERQGTYTEGSWQPVIPWKPLDGTLSCTWLATKVNEQALKSSDSQLGLISVAVPEPEWCKVTEHLEFSPVDPAPKQPLIINARYVCRSFLGLLESHSEEGRMGPRESALRFLAERLITWADPQILAYFKLTSIPSEEELYERLGPFLLRSAPVNFPRLPFVCLVSTVEGTDWQAVLDLLKSVAPVGCQLVIFGSAKAIEDVEKLSAKDLLALVQQVCDLRHEIVRKRKAGEAIEGLEHLESLRVFYEEPSFYKEPLFMSPS